MLKIYYLRVLKDIIGNVERVEGIEFMSQAICETTEDQNVRRVIIEENTNLAGLAVKIEEPTQRDVDNYNSLPEPAIWRDLFTEMDNLKARVKKLETK